MRVISDDESGLLLWHPEGSGFARIIDADGNIQHEITADRMRDPKLTVHLWAGCDILVLMPPAAAHSVWWFFEQGRFTGWYVNVEALCIRRPDSVDTDDHVLDIVVTPQREWERKDTDEFDERIGDPAYFDADTAVTIRAEGNRLIKQIEAGEFPFDGTYTDFQPSPQWQALRLTDTPEFPLHRPA